MSKHTEHNFACTRVGGMRERLHTFGQRIDPLNERCDRHMPVCERLQGWGKAATTRAHDGNFVDHEGCQRQCMRAGDRTLQNQGAAWTYALHSEGEPCRGASSFNDDVSQTRAPVAQQHRRNTELV